ncbi:hypothetical protein N6H18_13565 [Reichenbachiella agarivorans]|uniref:Protein TonB, links inner and outer membranes n=1 Tax=Reichenbachiella agarivorans TaxID=2979464 RepID=A0ABY6CPT5_9BACT|nr:hypothetical protein [Reichenbachiella agarivorans]UXP31378.1 hypothetical protein N6H18_13565 [Reichenbachiella agarivorans]
MDLNEKKNKITSAYISVGVHAVLIMLFFFMMAWTEPDPPIPEYGIEFNLGNEVISDSESDQPVKADEIAKVEEVKETEEAEEVTEKAETASQEKAQETEATSTDKVVDEVAKTEDINSPDVVKKVEEKVVKKEPVKEEKKTEVKEKEAVEKKEEAKATTTNSQPKVDDRAIYKKSEPGGGSGNKGASLDLSGWMWDSKPNPNDQSTEEGYIIFEITVDGDGEIINVKELQKTVSPAVANVYKKSITELTFSRTSDNRNTASTSTGKITFVIKSN